MKPYVKSNKSDIIDAEAIAEAATRPTMRFAAIKREKQADLQAVHRVRDQMIGTRTRLINQMRAFCLEYGIALRQGAGLFNLDLPLVLDDLSNDLSPAMRKLLVDLFADLRQLEQRITDEGDRSDRRPRRCCPPAHDDPRNRSIGSHRATGGRRHRMPVPEGSRPGRIAGAGPSRLLDRRQAEVTRYQQAREPLRSQAAARDHASVTWIEPGIAWEAGLMGYRAGCTRTKLLSHSPPRWRALSGLS